MQNNVRRTLVTAVALVLAPLALSAQQPGALDPSQLPEEAQAVLMELQEVQQQIQPIQQQALADPELQAEQAALGERIQSAMTEVNPQVPQRVQRLEALAAEAQAAQSAQDEARMGQIMTEARAIEMELQAAQNEAMQRPDLAPQLESFQAKVQAKMTEVDPAAGELIARLGELESRFMSLIVAGS